MLVDEFQTLFAPEKCVGGSLDGASVNFGGANGIAKKVQDGMSPFAQFCHCGSHRAALCMSSACKKNTFAANHLRISQRIYVRYAFSYKRR
jgi:hypothetical protein